MKKMFPKVGDVVKLNPDFLKVWLNRGNNSLGRETWKEDFTVIEVLHLEDYYISIIFKSKNKKLYRLYITSNGELSNFSDFYKEYKGIQVFITANLEMNNSIYCSCGGPKKENWVLGKKFYICIICKKEKIQT